MRALRLTAEWPVDTVAAAIVFPDGEVRTTGPVHHRFRIASIAKMLVGYTVLIGCEEGTVALDQPAGQPGCTIRHLLAHAGGYPFEGDGPIARPAQRRIYSNTGVELAADALAKAAGMPFGEYLTEAVLAPLGMNDTTLRGSPAHGVHSTVADLVAFVGELRAPRLLSPAGAAQFRTVQFPGLAGIVPGIGRFDECDWGLGTELRGSKHPHWTGTRNSPSTYGHFGGAGTLLWVDPGVHVACVALTDRPFDEWAATALHLWPAFGDAALTEAGV
ncbi:MAG TPA: serine hydrolase [Acidimicrobiaceae bacterium]|nr:serine hydrolase [Acidimicrobiaceae bacterium]